MNIKHRPILDIERVTEHFTAKDGVEITYVCTTDLKASDSPVDVFYRETAHPEFGNHYFGLFYDHYRDNTMICSADMIEELEFGMVLNDADEYEYSQSHHDYKQFENGNMIDGGRAYVRSSGSVVMMRVIKGKFIAKGVEDLTEFYYPGSDCQV